MCRLASRAYEHCCGLLRNQSTGANCHSAPSVSFFFWVLCIDKYCRHVLDVRRDTLNQIRRNKGVVEKREPLGVPFEVTIDDPYINIWTGAWLNCEDIPSVIFLVFCYPETNTLA